MVDIKFALLFLIGRSLSVRWNCVPQNFIYTYFTFKNYYFEFFYLTGRDNYFHVPKTVPVECTHSWWNAGMRSQTDDLHLVRFMQGSDSGKVLLEVSPLEVTSQVWPVKVTKAAALLTVAQVPAIILEVQMLAISRSCSYNIGKNITIRMLKKRGKVWTLIDTSLALSHFYFYGCRDVLFEYHRAVVPFCWAVRPVRSLSTF